MPTTTSTVIKQHYIKLNAEGGPLSSSAVMTLKDKPQSSTDAALKSLYTRAARAFVLRDVSTTHSLLQSAFSMLKPPRTSQDTLSDDRRKWDILRITFEATVYTSPPPSNNALPDSLHSILAEPPQAMMTSIYNRSLALFTPESANTLRPSLNAASLPSQVLTTLIYSSIKVNAPDVGRTIIEDWLSRREPRDPYDTKENGAGYEKVLELYCLHILPKLEQWEYAKEFLEYESELPSQKRQQLRTSLTNLLNQQSASLSSFRPSSSSSSFADAITSTSTSPRSYSPAPSSSSSSSVSTTSTHTIVPATPRGYRASGLSTITPEKSPSSSTSDSSKDTATPRVPHATLSYANGNGHAAKHPSTNGYRHGISSRPRSESRTRSSTSSVYSNLPRSKFAQEVASPRAAQPTTLALIKATLSPYLSSKRVTTVVLLFVILPLLSWLLRLRKRQRMAALGPLASTSGVLTAGGAAMAAASNADLVRRRLNANAGESGLMSRAWGGIVRAVGDTVRMAGSGLV